VHARTGNRIKPTIAHAQRTAYDQRSFCFDPCHEICQRSRSKIIYGNFNRTTTRVLFFSQRVIGIWNNLPSSVDFRSVSSFKTSLSSVNLEDVLHSLHIEPVVMVIVFVFICLLTVSFGAVVSGINILAVPRAHLCTDSYYCVLCLCVSLKLK